MAENVSMGVISLQIKGNADDAAKSVNKLSNNLGGLKKALNAAQATAFIATLKKIGSTITGLIDKQSSYINSLNNFRNIMNENTGAATEFINKAERLFGIDSSQLMTSMSNLQRLAEGFGLASDESYLMSKNLTQLAMDMTSTGLSFEQAMQKIKSGFAGELEPMRAYGVALDQATLQQTMYRLGIDRTYNSLTRAQKTELLYYQMMTQTTNIQGSLGKAMMTPAAATNMLRSAFIRLARAIGSIFIPIMMKIIPVVIAVTELLEQAAKAIASFFGFDIGDYSISLDNISAGLEDVGGGLDDVGGSARKATKELQKMLMPFDELNNVNFETGSSGGSGSGYGGVGGGSLGLDLPEYDIFKNVSTQMRDSIDKWKEKIKELLPIIELVGVALGGLWATHKIGNLLKWISSVKDAIANLGISAGTISILAGLALTITGITLVYGSIKKMLKGDLSPGNLLKGLAGALLVGVGTGLMFTPVVGIVLGISVAGVIGQVYLAKKVEPIMKTMAEELGIDYDGMNFFQKLLFRINMDLEILGLKEASTNITKGIHETLQNILKGIGQWFRDLPGKIGEWLGEITGKYWKWRLDIEKKIIEGIINFIKKLPEYIKGIIDYLKEIDLKDVAKFIVEGFWKGIKWWWDWNIGILVDFIKSFIDGFKKGFGINSPSTVMFDIAKNIVLGLINGILSMKDALLKIVFDIKDNIVKKFEEMKENVKNKAAEIKSNVINRFMEIKNNALKPIQDAKNNILNIFESMKKGIKDKIEYARDSVGRAIDRIKSFFNFSWSLPHINLPHFSWTSKPASGWIANILSALNLPTSLPKLNVEWYESGGFPEQGQLFFANENGPELIGNIGNRAAVANQDQIIEGIASGTYTAISRAFQENKGNNDMNPYFVINLGNERLYNGYAKHKDNENNMYGVTL